MKKIQIILLLISTNIYSQVFTDTTKVWFGGKEMNGSDLIYSGTKMRLLDMDSINKQLEKQFWEAQKHDLSVILGGYLKTKSKKIVGYNFISWESVSENTSSSLGCSVYFASEKNYAPVGQNLWIYSDFENRREVIEDLKNINYAKRIIYNLNIEKIVRVEPIEVEIEKKLLGFYEWLRK